MQQFQSIALRSGLYNETLLSIYNKPNKLFRQVASFSTSEQAIAVKELLMYDTQDKRTDAYETLMRDFYLENTEIYRRRK